MSRNDYLMDDARALLSKAERNPAVLNYRTTLPLSPIWRDNERSKLRFLKDLSSFDAIAQLQTILFVHSPSAHDARLAVEWNLRRLGLLRPDTADSAFDLYEASEFAPAESVVRIGKRRYWHDDFRHIGAAFRMMHACDYTSLDRIVELGAGAGNLARFLKLYHHKDAQYIIIDLPDTLVFSMMYLRLNFPDAKWLFVTEGMEIPETGYDFIFIPVGLESVLHGKKIDAFINTASLGEMRIETVKYWFDFVQEKTDTRYIFSVNRFLNLITPGPLSWRFEENTSALQFDKKWDIIDFELVPDFLRCPWQNRHARQCLIFGKHREVDKAFDPALITDASTGSWNTPGNEMTIYDPPFNHDFTMTGPLFAYWEAHRLNPCPETKAAFTHFLAHLRGNTDKRFEEEPHLS